MKRFKKASIIFLMFMLLSVIAMPVSASAAKLNKKSVSLNVGKTYTLKATGTKGKITWTSSNKSVATVSSKGVVKARKKGTAVITAKYGKKKLTCKVTVKQPVTSLKLNKKAANITVGGKITLKATVSPTTANNKTVIWKSSNTSVATVSSKGVVVGKTSGTVTITATAKDGSKKTASCKVTVQKQNANTTPTYKAVEITSDNWQNYIEKVEFPYYKTDAFGEFETLWVNGYYIVKPEYMPYLDMEKSSIAMEIAYNPKAFNITIDLPNKKYTLSDCTWEYFPRNSIIKFEKVGPLWGEGYPEFLQKKVYFGAMYSCGVTDSNKKSISNYPTNETVKRIQGTLYLNK